MTTTADDVEGDASKATQTFVTALVFNAAVGGAEVVGFVLLKNWFKKIYQPRTYLVPERKRVPEITKSWYGWFLQIIKHDTRDIIYKNGLDAYVFVRFLMMMIWIFVPFTLLTWPVLLPVDVVNSGGTGEGLDKYTFGNIGSTKQQQKRYAAHIILVYIFTFYVMWLIKREFGQFVRDRHEFLTSKEHSELPQSRTVLVTGVPQNLLNIESLRKLTSYLPGGSKRIWIARDYKDLPDLYEESNKLVLKYEGAVTSLSKVAAKIKLKSEKKGGSPEDAVAWTSGDPEALNNLVPQKKRPSHRLGKVPCFGEKVDTIDYCREQLSENNRKLAEKRADLFQYDAQNSAFIEFNTQIAAHLFHQSLASELPLRMALRYVEVAPENVIWSNLNINPYQFKIRYAISWALTIGLIIFWAIPVAFVGMISNVDKLCATVPWMQWLCDLPVPVNGIVQGVLPPAALAVLMMLLPIVLRLMAQHQGIPLKTGVELSLMTRFFIFQVIHGFLIVTLSSGLVAAVPEITQNPSSAVSLLANRLPQASTFFLTFFVTAGFSGAAGSLLQISGLVLHYVFLYLLGSTPRKVAGIARGMGSVAWGTLFPTMTLFTVIGIVYSIIAPIMNAFAALVFFLFWFVYKYLFLWVLDMPAAMESAGSFFPLAIQHLFVGLYIECLCLTGLFFLARDDQGNLSTLPQAILMIVLIVILVLYHSTINSSYWPMVHNIPLSLAPKIEKLQGKDQSSASYEKSGGGSAGTPSPQHEQFSHGAPLEPGHSNTTAVDEGRHSFVDEKKHQQSLGPVHEDRKQSSFSGETADDADNHRDRVHAFDYPATYKPVTTAWFADDTLGIGKNEVRAASAANVSASTDNATMNEKGKVEVTSDPPEEK